MSGQRSPLVSHQARLLAPHTVMSVTHNWFTGREVGHVGYRVTDPGDRSLRRSDERQTRRTLPGYGRSPQSRVARVGGYLAGWAIESMAIVTASIRTGSWSGLISTP